MLLEGVGIATTFPEGNMAVSNKGSHTCSVLCLIHPVMLPLESQVQEQPRSQYDYIQREAHRGIPRGGGTLGAAKCPTVRDACPSCKHPHSEL